VSTVAADIRLGIGHQVRNTWRMSKPFAIGGVIVTIGLHAFALLTAAMQERLATSGFTVAHFLPLMAGLWSALALLPALGGGESDDPMALAAAGADRSFRFGARLMSALTDAGPGVFIPAMALVGAAAAGWPGWLAGLALALNGLACGQLSGAASGILVQRIGPTGALLGMAGVVLLSATVLASSGIGPGAWWLAAIDDPVYDLLLFGTGLAALGGAWALNRPAEQEARQTRTITIPQHPFLAVLAAMIAGIGRSVMARSTLITAMLAPMLVRSAGQEVSSSVAFFVTAAAAAVLGANGFAYDGGAAVWLLGKIDRWSIITTRWLATMSWALLIAVVAAVSSWLVGAPPPLGLVPELILVIVAAASSGLVPSVRRPANTDFNSFRAQPAPVASAMGTLARSVLLTVLVLALPLPVGAVLVGCYSAIALLHAHLSLRDPVALAALT
jgi:hypothetical protein